MEVISTMKDNCCILSINGKVDSSNAKQFEEQALGGVQGDRLVLDLKNLEYISSAGLRVILNLRKRYPGIELVNASTNVYEIMDMTGFTEIMKVTRALREISLEGAELIGQGANGSVYRTDDDTVVKVYRDDISLDTIENERNVARKALVFGIPTAISYDLVMVNGCYATVFEMLNASSFAKLLQEHPEKLKEYASIVIDLLKLIHEIEIPKGGLPEEKQIFLDYVHFLHDYLPGDSYEKLLRLAEAIPNSQHIMHGDYHIKNVMFQNNEAILIDMDTLAVGDPILEFAFMYNAYLGYSLFDENEIKDFLGITHKTGELFWKECLKDYFVGTSEEELRKIEMRAKMFGLVRIYRSKVRFNSDIKIIENYKNELIKMIDLVDSF